MNLYDFLTKEQGDFDTYDTVFDVCVTVCEPYEYDEDEEKEFYDVFNDLIMKNVSVIKKISECECLCNWSDFILFNKAVFKAAAEELWPYVPKTEDNLVYEWIKEIHAWMAGYTSEKVYKTFVTKYGKQLKAA